MEKKNKRITLKLAEYFNDRIPDGWNVRLETKELDSEQATVMVVISPADNHVAVELSNTITNEEAEHHLSEIATMVSNTRPTDPRYQIIGCGCMGDMKDRYKVNKLSEAVEAI